MKEVPIKRKISGSNAYPETRVMEVIGYALVDDQHYSDLIQYIWTLNNGYVQRSIGHKNVFMHNDIWRRLESRPHIKLDHIDRNPLNNQLNNFRLATDPQNSMNRGLVANSTSGFKGVSLRNKKYRANIKANGRHMHLGYFDTALEAAKVYDIAAVKYFGEFAVTNKSLGKL